MAIFIFLEIFQTFESENTLKFNMRNLKCQKNWNHQHPHFFFEGFMKILRGPWPLQLVVEICSMIIKKLNTYLSVYTLIVCHFHNYNTPTRQSYSNPISWVIFKFFYYKNTQKFNIFHHIGLSCLNHSMSFLTLASQL